MKRFGLILILLFSAAAMADKASDTSDDTPTISGQPPEQPDVGSESGSKDAEECSKQGNSCLHQVTNRIFTGCQGVKCSHTDADTVDDIISNRKGTLQPDSKAPKATGEKDQQSQGTQPEDI